MIILHVPFAFVFSMILSQLLATTHIADVCHFSYLTLQLSFLSLNPIWERSVGKGVKRCREGGVRKRLKSKRMLWNRSLIHKNKTGCLAKSFKKNNQLCPLCRLELHDWNIEAHPTNAEIKQQLKSEAHIALYTQRKKEEQEEKLVEEMTLCIKISIGNLHQNVPAQVKLYPPPAPIPCLPYLSSPLLLCPILPSHFEIGSELSQMDLFLVASRQYCGPEEIHKRRYSFPTSYV